MIFLLFAAAWAAPSLEELKKVDFSIVVKDAKARPAPEERCFFRPEVNQALMRVQQRLRLVQLGLQVDKCYRPSDAQFGKGAAVAVAPAKVQKGARLALNKAMLAEGFKEKGKGIFLHETWDRSPVESVPVAELP